MKRNGHKKLTDAEIVQGVINSPRLQLTPDEAQTVNRIAKLLVPIFEAVAAQHEVRFEIVVPRPIFPELPADTPPVHAAHVNEKRAALLATIPVDSDPVVHLLGDTKAAAELIGVAEAVTRAGALGQNIRGISLTQICQRAILQAAKDAENVCVHTPEPAKVSAPAIVTMG